ncbi:MAG: DUF1425 domain-containing protein [bacterium]
MKLFRHYLMPLVTGVLLTACASGPYQPEPQSLNAETSGAPVIFLDEGLVDNLAVDRNVLVQRDDAQRLKIQATMRNRTDDETLHIQVQTVWRNKSGIALYSETGSESAWQTIMLTPNQSSTYTQTALTSEASQYTIRVRYQARPN